MHGHNESHSDFGYSVGLCGASEEGQNWWSQEGATARWVPLGPPLTSQWICPCCSHSHPSVLTKSRKGGSWTACAHRNIKFVHWAARQRFQTTAWKLGEPLQRPGPSWLPTACRMSGHPLCGLAADSPDTLLLSPADRADSVCTWGQFLSSPGWILASATVWLSLACANVSGKNRKFRGGGKCLAEALSPEPGHLLHRRAERAGE